MNKVIAVLLGLMLCAGLVSAQSNATPYLLRSADGVDTWAITNWGAFASDSMALTFSNEFDCAQYDSLNIWVRGSSSDGVCNWRSSLWGGFVSSSVSSRATYMDSLGVAGDTTNVKLETLQYIGRVNLNGAVRASIRVEGINVSNAATANRKDAKVNVYLVGHKRTYTGPR